MKKTLEVLNRLRSHGTISDYAIGGSMGALFYTEAVTTMDLDVFLAKFNLNERFEQWKTEFA